MNDTSPEMQAKMLEMIQNKTPEERLNMGCSMYDFSKYMITEAIRRENPSISEGDLRCEIFLRFYGNDFSELDKVKILESLRKTA